SRVCQDYHEAAFLTSYRAHALYALGRAVPTGRIRLRDWQVTGLETVILGPIWVWIGVGEVPSLYTIAGGAIVLGAICFQAILGMRLQREKSLSNQLPAS
ncbi:MAG: hypothetical protein AAF420_01770, partial [Pseudomonadota bacterium]